MGINHINFLLIHEDNISQLHLPSKVHNTEKSRWGRGHHALVHQLMKHCHNGWSAFDYSHRVLNATFTMWGSMYLSNQPGNTMHWITRKKEIIWSAYEEKLVQWKRTTSKRVMVSPSAKYEGQHQETFIRNLKELIHHLPKDHSCLASSHFFLKITVLIFCISLTVLLFCCSGL